MKTTFYFNVFIAILCISSLSAQRTINYSYDANQRLTEVSYSGKFRASYVYDKAGNRISYSSKIITDLKSSVKNQQTAIYPNPFSSDILYIQSKDAVDQVELFDITGKRISCRLNNSGTILTITEPISEGMYICRLYSDTNIIKLKVVRVK